MSDAQWLADLLAHGLVRGSFVPPAPIQALRELTRTRKQLGREVTAHSQRIEKVLESADVKLAAVLHSPPAHRARNLWRAGYRVHHVESGRTIHTLAIAIEGHLDCDAAEGDPHLRDGVIR